jgi:hypothetical protein
MDINLFRIGVTAVSFAAFLFIVVWTYLPSRRQSLDRQGRSILEDSET